MSTIIQPKPVHGAPKSKDVPTDMQDTPPIPCAFKVGDPVVYTNDNGVSFVKRVRGFAGEIKEFDHGRFIYTISPDGRTEGSAWWFAVHPDSLRLIHTGGPTVKTRRVLAYVRQPYPNGHRAEWQEVFP